MLVQFLAILVSTKWNAKEQKRILKKVVETFQLVGLEYKLVPILVIVCNCVSAFKAELSELVQLKLRQLRAIQEKIQHSE